MENNNSYFEKLEWRFTQMNERFDKAPYIMLMADVVCALWYAVLYGTAMNSEAILVAYITGGLLGIAVIFGVIYTISVVFKNTEKTFPVAFSSIITVFLLCWDMLIVVESWAEFFDFIEWIPVLIFMVLSMGWCIYIVQKLRKEIKGKKVKQKNIPRWIIRGIVVTLVPILTYPGRRSFGHMLPDNIAIYYFAYLTLLINIVLLRLVLESGLYCVRKLFKGK